MKSIMRTLLAILGLVLAAPAPPVVAQDARPADPGSVTAPAGEDVPIYKPGPYEADQPWDALKVGEFSLVDQLGRPVTNETLKGKPWVANFIFTRCAFECPLLMGKAYNNLHQRLKDVDFRIVTITVDPKFDDVARMKKQSDVFGIDPDRWLFVTGPEEKVYELIRKGFKQAAWENVNAQAGMEFAHSLSMIHVDKDGTIVGKYDGRSDAELETLAQVLEGKIKTPKRNSPVAVTTEPPSAREDANRPPLPEWVERLPATNAMLNMLATMLLLGGYSAIKAQTSSEEERQRQIALHKKLMLTAFATSITFLGFYLTYHFMLQHYTGDASRRFQGQGPIRTVYFAILISHVILAALVPLGALATIFYAYREKWDRHRRVAKVTYPVWLYVSITGVVIYLMLYHMPV
jgi:protein SCO1/2/putative membrane protein